VDIDAPSPGTEDGRAQKSRQQNLYRSALDRGRSTRRDNDGSASESRGTSPAAHSVADEEAAESLPSPAAHDAPERSTWFKHPLDENFLDGESIKPNEKFTRTRYVMYGNGSIYCFVRLFCLLYERLAALKANEAEAHTVVKRAMQHKPATDLGWIEKQPNDFFRDTSPSANLYSQMLGLFDQLIRNDVEMSHIEEALRRYYLQDGWQLYSLDKLLGSISRFAVSMVASDPREKSTEIYNLFKKDRARGKETSHQEELNYRRQVDKHIKDADIFRIVWDEVESAVEIQLFKPDDPTHDPSEMSEADIWKAYVSAYENVVPTEGTQYIRTASIPYMRRSYRQQWGEDQAGTERSIKADRDNADAMLFRVGMKDYKLVFEPETSETTLTAWSKTTDAEVSQEAERRGAAASESFQANSEWMKGLSRDNVDDKKQSFSTLFT